MHPTCCLADWRREAAEDLGVEMTKDEARTRIYGMAYAEWKEKYQRPATAEQMAAFEARGARKTG